VGEKVENLGTATNNADEKQQNGMRKVF